MKVVIIGQQYLAQQVLLRLASLEGADVIRTISPTASDRLYVTSLEQGVKPIAVQGSIGGEHIPDGTELIVCAHNKAYIKKDAINKAEIGAISYHPSLLPRHRGGDAVKWAVHMKEAISGGTVYWVNDKVDAGPIAARRSCFIRSDDTASLLWRRELAPLGVELIESVVKDVLKGVIIQEPQDENVVTWEPSFSQRSLRAG
ncbi:hypothetical protein I6M49_21665 [Shewanella algae]|uniref:formyltransferase family protein n=1 Tax=Shewanella algae TaxID=38313 RepID=UPI001AAD46A0|nr:formyltransferase family protein [Shewanella algae]MBO2656055.1 hypothetical protein [Shewanella algae]